MMLETAVPVSHLLLEDRPLADDLFAAATWAEFKFVTDLDPPGRLGRAFHWGKGIIEHDFLDEADRTGLFEFMDRQGVDLFSFDLGPACRRSLFCLPLSETLTGDRIFSLADDRLRRVRGRYWGRLAVENYNYYPTGLYEHICQPGFINRFVRQFEIEFVFDIAHAQVSAANLGLGFWDYAEEFPWQKTTEVHLSRAFFHPRTAVDAHLEPGDDEFDLLEQVLQRLPAGNRPVLVVIEYFAEPGGVRRCHQRLTEIVARLNRDAEHVYVTK